MRVIEKHITNVFDKINVLMLLYLSYQCLHLWMSPSASEVVKVNEMTMLVVLEFLLIHSALFTFLPKSPVWFFIISSFYVVFAYFIVKTNSSVSVFVSYCFVIFNRLYYIFLDLSDDEINIIARKIKVRAIFYIGLFIPWILIFINLQETKLQLPRLGLTIEFLMSDTDFFKNIYQSESLAIKYPHIFIAFGVIYFIGLAYIELKIDSLIPSKVRKENER